VSAPGGDLSKLASVASFFVSRIDIDVDALIDERLSAGTSAAERGRLEILLGKVAIANAKVAYQRDLELFGGARWEALERRGAHTQRLLWASTSTKNPKYPDVLYGEELIGPHTVSTMPMRTLDAFRDHGQVRPSLNESPEAAAALAELEALGISLEGVRDKLTKRGVELFAEEFDKLPTRRMPPRRGRRRADAREFPGDPLYNDGSGQRSGQLPRRQDYRRRRAIPAKVFVGNLSFRTTKEELNQILSAAGTVVDVYMPTDRVTGKPRGFAFVEFASEGEAAEAIRQFNGREVGGRALKLNLAEERPQRRPAPRAFGPPEASSGPSFFAVEGRFSRPKGSRRGTRGHKRSL
jgi:hypothetical protein